MVKTSRSRSNVPTKLTIRSYQVGFGDCFLLTFHYTSKNGKSKDRHVLIDCGSTGRPKNSPTLKEVAELIKEHCDHKLTAVIATHRHADHINGFATNKAGTASGDILRELEPDVVLQPWTEHPNAAKKATQLSDSARADTRGLSDALFVAGLQGMHEVARAVQQEVKQIGHYWSKSLQKQLAFLGEENLANLSAVTNLIAMGKKGKSEYLSYGDETSLEKKLPGVTIRVLGPPTPAQYPEVAKQRSKDASEFWHILGLSGSRLAARQLNPFPRTEPVAKGKYPPESRWLIGRIRAIHGAQRLAIVRALDDAMNNTSLILLFEVGGKKFLFPGDAQIENWSYALKDAPDAQENRKLLAGTDFYKVGHHGSLNATPKTLWNLFKKRGDETKRKRLHTAVSTMAGKHGSTGSKTEVPRRTLVAALDDESEFFTTQLLKKQSDLFREMEFDV